MLEDEQVLTPTVYDFHTNGVRHRHLNEHKPFEWCGGTVAYILEREEYIGTTVNCRSFYPSFKKRKASKTLLKSGCDLKIPMNQLLIRKHGRLYNVCVLASVDPTRWVRWTYYLALFVVPTVVSDITFAVLVARAMDKHQAQLKKELSAKMRECEKGTKRLADLDKLFRKAFEEMTLEHLSNQQFQMLTQGYEVEKQELSQRVEFLKTEIASSQDKMLNSDRFLKLVDKYTDIQELTPELVREFIDKIVVHERSEPRKKKNYTQQVDVYFNFVGRV